MRFLPYDTAFVASVRAGGLDANGQPAERALSDGNGTPCRACLHDVKAGAEMLVLAARPFPTLQPYAETGPIFLHADACAPWHGDGVPPILRTSPEYLVKGYTAEHRIRYGTGAIVPREMLRDHIATILADSDIAYVDIRSARNNCFQTRAIRD